MSFNIDMDFIKEVLGKGFTVLKTGFSVLTSEIDFVKYLYNYGKRFIGMAKELSGQNEE